MCVKSARIWSYSGPYFPAFGLNTERHEVSIGILSVCGKIWTTATPKTDTSHAVFVIRSINEYCSKRDETIKKIKYKYGNHYTCIENNLDSSKTQRTLINQD